MVDIVGMVESAHFLSVEYAPRRAEISLMTREKAVQLSDRRDRMGAASAQLRAGAAALAGPLERDNRFLSDVRELLGPVGLSPWHNGLAAVLVPQDLFGSLKTPPDIYAPLQPRVREMRRVKGFVPSTNTY